MDLNYVKGLVNKVFLTDSPTGFSENVDKVILEEWCFRSIY